MSKSLTILVGNLGNDPETRHMPNGDAVTTISMATTEKWKDKGGEKQERATWHRVTLFGRLGEIAAQYLRKGSQVMIEGTIRNESYDDPKTGQKKFSTSIIARDMTMLGGKADGAARPAQGGGNSKLPDSFDDEPVPF